MSALLSRPPQAKLEAMDDTIDPQWARRVLAAFDARFHIEAKEIADLRASGISESSIAALYPFDFANYEVKLTATMRYPKLLHKITGILLLIGLRTGSIFALPTAEKDRVLTEIGPTSRQMLNAVLALPEAERPGHFTLRPDYYTDDLGAASFLCQDLALIPYFLHLGATQQEEASRVGRARDWKMTASRIEQIVEALA
jgi:hypothetical protein